MKNVNFFGLVLFLGVLVLVGCNAGDPFAELRVEIAADIDEFETRLDYILENFEDPELSQELMQFRFEIEDLSISWWADAHEIGSAEPFVAGETYCQVADLEGCIEMPEIYKFREFLETLEPLLPQG